MRKSKLGWLLLAAVLVLTLGASSALAEMKTIVVSLDAEQPLIGTTEGDSEFTLKLTTSANTDTAIKLTATARETTITTAELTAAAHKITLTDAKVKTTTDSGGSDTVTGVISGGETTLEFTLDAGQTVAGSYDPTAESMSFTASPDAKLTAKVDEAEYSIALGGKKFTLKQDSDTKTSFSITGENVALVVTAVEEEEEEEATPPATGQRVTGVTAAATGEENEEDETAAGVTYTFAEFALKGSADVEEAVEGEPFDKATVVVSSGDKTITTLTFTSKDVAKAVLVSADTIVSFDIDSDSDVLKVVSGDKALASTDKGAYSIDVGSSTKIVTIKFASGDNGGSFDVTLTLSVDATADSVTTAETYVLNLSNDIKFVGSNGQTVAVAPKGNNVNLATDFATSQDNAKAWTPKVAFSVSSDVFTEFEIEISTDKAKAIALKDPAGDAISDFDGKTIDPAGIEGAYTVVFSADLVLSGDATKVSTDAGFFSIKLEVVSVSVTSSSTVPEDTSSQSTTPGENDTITAGKEVSAGSAETATSSAGGGTKIAAPGQKINNIFMNSSTGAVDATAIANFFSSITDTAEPATASEMTSALAAAGITYDIGDEEKGFRAVGLKLDTPVSDDLPFFALVNHRTLAAGKHIGFGYTKTVNGIFIILFNLMRNPFNTTYFMEVDAGENDVAGTDAESSEEDSTAGTTRVNKVVFITADGAKAFAVKTDEPVTLQGQTQAGNNTEASSESGEDDDQVTSRHGGSSGCDAGGGLIALAALALAARKVRK